MKQSKLVLSAIVGCALVISASASAVTYSGGICEPLGGGGPSLSHFYGSIFNPSSSALNVTCAFPKSSDHICTGTYINVFDRDPATPVICAIYQEYFSGSSLFDEIDSESTPPNFEASNMTTLNFDIPWTSHSGFAQYYYSTCTIPPMNAINGASHIVSFSIRDCDRNSN